MRGVNLKMCKLIKGLILVLTIVLVSSNLIGCSSNAKPTIIEPEVQAETVKNFIQAINEGDLDGVENLLASNATYVDKTVEGDEGKTDKREEVINIIKYMIDNESNFTIDSIVQNDKGLAVVEGRVTSYLTKLAGMNEGLRYTSNCEILDQKISYLEYVENEEDVNVFNNKTEGVVGINFEFNDGDVVILGCAEGMPAEQSGLKQGDRIEAVDGMKVAEMKHGIDELAYRIRGAAGTKVSLSINRAGNNFDVELQRE